MSPERSRSAALSLSFSPSRPPTLSRSHALTLPPSHPLAQVGGVDSELSHRRAEYNQMVVQDEGVQAELAKKRARIDELNTLIRKAHVVVSQLGRALGPHGIAPTDTPARPDETGALSTVWSGVERFGPGGSGSNGRAVGRIESERAAPTRSPTPPQFQVGRIESDRADGAMELGRGGEMMMLRGLGARESALSSSCSACVHASHLRLRACVSAPSLHAS